MREMWKKLRNFFHEYGKFIFSVILVFGIIFFAYSAVLVASPHKLRVSFLDVGQGDAIFIQTPSGQEMLIDGGATNVVLEKLADEMSYFDTTIEMILATHPDADHVTGLIPVLEKFNISYVLLSPSSGKTMLYDDMLARTNKEDAVIRVAHRGDVIDFHDGVVVHVLYPSKNYKGNESDTNDASVSVVLTYKNISFLLTGDLPSTREGMLIEKSNQEHLPQKVTVYKAGHHGSNTSSGELLLSYIKPEYAIISAGKDNKYGHPNPETLLRLGKYSKEILSTIDRGTISFITDGRVMEVETEK